MKCEHGADDAESLTNSNWVPPGSNVGPLLFTLQINNINFIHSVFHRSVLCR